jgi:hypothetical protein
MEFDRCWNFPAGCRHNCDPVMFAISSENFRKVPTLVIKQIQSLESIS